MLFEGIKNGAGVSNQAGFIRAEGVIPRRLRRGC